ncbi:MAG: hypothetical protein MZV49_17125 [Rhodopseudomonas palustris]|nr:hypothetical protein [Rhodopseudomonas palustris]
MGDGYWFIDQGDRLRQGARGVRPADRPEPGRPVPDRRRATSRCEAADLMRCKALRAVRRRPALRRRGQHGQACWRPRPRWEAANACLQTHGGFGFAEEYDVERKFRETRLYQVAPISTNLMLSLHRRAHARHAALVLRALPSRTSTSHVILRRSLRREVPTA